MSEPEPESEPKPEPQEQDQALTPKPPEPTRGETAVVVTKILIYCLVFPLLALAVFYGIVISIALTGGFEGGYLTTLLFYVFLLAGLAIGAAALCLKGAQWLGRRIDGQATPEQSDSTAPGEGPAP